MCRAQARAKAAGDSARNGRVRTKDGEQVTAEGLNCGVSPKPRTNPPCKLAVALLSLSWALQERLIASSALREKLAVPNSELVSSLASLTVRERRELKREIQQFAALRSWPGPLNADEVCSSLDKIISQTRKRT